MGERDVIKMPYPQITDLSKSMVLSMRDVLPLKKFARAKDGAAYYDVCEACFMELAEEAEAIYKVGKMVLVNMQILDNYLEQFRIHNQKKLFF